MRLNKLIGAFLLIFAIPSFAQELPMVEISKQPECVHIDRSKLHFPGNRDNQDTFYALIDSLTSGNGRSVNIWHIGGSHVQAGYFSSRLHKNLISAADSLKGDRGFVFPYKIAKTNYDNSYLMTSTGQWSYALASKKHPNLNPNFGAMGIAVHTSDSSATLTYVDTLWSFNSLRIMGYASSDAVRPIVVNGLDTISCSIDTLTQSFVFQWDDLRDSSVIGFQMPEGESFTLTGIEPASGRVGINYYCSGVNGATLSNWLDDCVDFERDIQIIAPDLAIFAVGINDSACKQVDFKVDKFKDNYRRLIGLIKSQNPDCAVIFITNNDSYRYIRRGMTYNYNAPAVQKAMFELAQDYGAAVFDLYDIMGGKKDCVLEWRSKGLVRKDKLHFTKEGYELLGDLLYNAIIDDYNSKLLPEE